MKGHFDSRYGDSEYSEPVDYQKELTLFKSVRNMPDFLVLGPYVLVESKMLAVVLVETSTELSEASTYIYSTLGLAKRNFYLYERALFPVGSGMIHKYSLIDEVNLELQKSVSIDDLDQGDEWDDFDPHDASTVMNILCPLLGRLVPLAASGFDIDELYEVDRQILECDYPGILGCDSPDFW